MRARKAQAEALQAQLQGKAPPRTLPIYVSQLLADRDEARRRACKMMAQRDEARAKLAEMEGKE